jgi:GNAT superfamily N-acetyltransferase
LRGGAAASGALRRLMALLSVRAGVAGDDAACVARLVNAAYARGEEGMWVPGTARTSEDEVRALLGAGRLVLALDRRGAVEGSANLYVGGEAFGRGVAEFGMLAVAEHALGHGVGRTLLRECQARAKAAGCTALRLEILHPSGWQHPAKTRLEAWYRREGFLPSAAEDFGRMFPHLQSSLACDCSFTVYLKQL